MAREAEFRYDLQRPLAQGDAVVRAETHVSPVKPLHAGGPRGAAVHLDGRSCVAWFLRTAKSSLAATEGGGAR